MSTGDPIPSPFPFGYGAPVRVTVDPAWIERLKLKQDAIRQLSRGLRAHLSFHCTAGVDDICESIEYLLGAEISEQLAQLEKIENNPPKMPRATIDDLEQAQRTVEEQEDALEATDAMILDLPETSARFIRTTQRPMMQAQLDRSREWLQRIQQSLEEDSGFTAPADTSTSTETGSQTKGEE